MIFLKPKKVKYNKIQRGKLKGKILNSNLIIGSIGLKSLEPAWLYSNQIQVIKNILIKNTKKYGSYYMNLFPNKPITKKSKESRMGSGKGDVCDWVAVIKIGTILFELIKLPDEINKKILNLIKYKLPIKTKIIYKNI